jgi:hypothetical protein
MYSPSTTRLTAPMRLIALIVFPRRINAVDRCQLPKLVIGQMRSARTWRPAFGSDAISLPSPARGAVPLPPVLERGATVAVVRRPKKSCWPTVGTPNLLERLGAGLVNRCPVRVLPFPALNSERFGTIVRLSAGEVCGLRRDNSVALSKCVLPRWLSSLGKHHEFQ